MRRSPAKVQPRHPFLDSSFSRPDNISELPRHLTAAGLDRIEPAFIGLSCREARNVIRSRETMSSRKVSFAANFLLHRYDCGSKRGRLYSLLKLHTNSFLDCFNPNLSALRPVPWKRPVIPRKTGIYSNTPLKVLISLFRYSVQAALYEGTSSAEVALMS